MKTIISIFFLTFYLFGFGQYEEQYLKVHLHDSIKSIKVYYFNYGTKVNLAKHQGYRSYTFGSHGKTLTSKSVDEKNKTVWEYQYSYDSLNRMTKEIYKPAGMEPEITEFTYDGENATGEVHSGIVAAFTTNEFSYDDDKNMIEVKTLEDGKETGSDKYEYKKFDKKNNWTEMIWIRDGKPFRTYIRKLVYFKK
jgi:hypothetical protein